jgi:PAS domain S-box-containing protein
MSRLHEWISMWNAKLRTSELTTPFARYALAILLVGLVTLLRLPLDPALGGRSPFSLFYVPVVIVAWYGGAMPTLVTALLSAGIAWYFFLPPERSWKVEHPGDWVALGLFFVVCAMLTAMSRAASGVRRRAEDALALAHRAQSAASAAVWESDMQGALVETGELPRLFGLDEKAPPERLQQVVHAEDRDRVAKAARDSLETRSRFRAEFRIQHPKLGERWLASIGEPVRQPSGRPARMAGLTIDVTERKRGEAAIARLAAIVEASNDPIIGARLDGTIESWNAAAESLFSYTHTEAIGRNIVTLIPPDHRAEYADLLKQVSSGERPQHLESVRLTKEGHPVEVMLTVSPIRSEAGAIIGISEIVRDVTELKRAAQALAAQREWFRVTLSSIGDAVIASDCEGRVTFMNGVAEKLTGWPTREAEGKPLVTVFNIVNERTGDRVDNPSENVIRSGRIIGLANQAVLISRDGIERPIADSAAPIWDGGGKILGVVLVFHDVSEQRRAQAALAEQREWFETTLESIGDAVIATDINRKVIFMNPVAEYLTGWRLQQAKDRDSREVFKIINEETRQAVEDPIGRVLNEGVVVGLANHTVLVAADGEEHPIDDSGAPIRDREGRIVGVVLVFRDVSERRRADAAKQASLQERERLLNSERLARAEAERANRLKDEFVATLSHELRTPLTAILGWTQIMQHHPGDTDRVQHGLSIIERNTRAQARLVSDLLDVSRIIAGKLRLDVEPVNLPAIVQAALETQFAAAEAKGVVIRQSLDANIGEMIGDPARLQQVVWNLITNAVKFTPAGGCIDVSLRRAGSNAEIVIADSGIGINADFLSRLFDRFSQAERSSSRRFGGLGLGLSIVKELVQLHGGTVVAESPGEGRGATFKVTLPITQTEGAMDRSEDGEENARTEDASRLHDIRILVVEDESDARELIKRILEDCGAIVTTAASAQEGIETLSKSHPDMLVSDIGLPEVDGYELVRRVRARGPAEGGAIPAIAVTAFAGAEDRTRALRAGYQAHVPKPIEPHLFVSVVASFVDLIAPRPS